ncbi:DUF732 domain-containing protein [Rhodococcus sp. (in: high G+C Gram-positive bacteria)]|uniref:DUF732 domain-containing protein n=1 Tax=Rhodococcus sp. TaxID=1831 RepID=UPI003F107610
MMFPNKKLLIAPIIIIAVIVIGVVVSVYKSPEERKQQAFIEDLNSEGIYFAAGYYTPIEQAKRLCEEIRDDEEFGMYYNMLYWDYVAKGWSEDDVALMTVVMRDHYCPELY